LHSGVRRRIVPPFRVDREWLAAKGYGESLRTDAAFHLPTINRPLPRVA
jgi:hypothetical protein